MPNIPLEAEVGNYIKLKPTREQTGRKLVMRIFIPGCPKWTWNNLFLSGKQISGKNEICYFIHSYKVLIRRHIYQIGRFSQFSLAAALLRNSSPHTSSFLSQNSIPKVSVALDREQTHKKGVHSAHSHNYRQIRGKSSGNRWSVPPVPEQKTSTTKSFPFWTNHDTITLTLLTLSCILFLIFRM